MFSKKIKLITLLSAVIFFSISYIYFVFLTSDFYLWHEYPENSDIIYYPLNTDFTKLLFPALEELINIRNNGGLSISDIANNKFYFKRGLHQSGLYYLYSVFIYLYLDIYTNGILGISLIFNSCLVIISYNYFQKILTHVSINKSYSYLFFLNPLLIWYSQGLNKEIILIALMLGGIYFFLKGYKKKLFITILLIGLVRWQLLLAIPCIIFFYKIENKNLAILIIYIFTSFLAVYIYNDSSSIITSSYESISRKYLRIHSVNTGFSNYIFNLNNNYYIGNLIFNPIRFVQYLYDQFSSIMFYNTNNKINLYYLSNIMINIYLLFNVNRIFKIFTNYKKYLRTNLEIIIYIIIACFFIILISPIIQSRYIAPLLFPIILLVIYSNENKTK